MMYKVDDLTLITGGNIIINDPPVEIQQPSIKQISLVGEREFFRSLNIFDIDSEPLVNFINGVENIDAEEKELMIEAITEYDNLLFFMKSSFIGEGQDQFQIVDMAKVVFNLIMPDYEFVFNQETGDMLLMNQKENSHSIVVDREFFDLLKDIANQIFLLDKFFGTSAQPEMSEGARRIAQKMEESEKKIRRMKGEEAEGTSYFARILSVMGLKKELEYLSSLTVYQLDNQFERMNLFVSYDQSLKAHLAGATNIEITDWYKKI